MDISCVSSVSSCVRSVLISSSTLGLEKAVGVTPGWRETAEPPPRAFFASAVVVLRVESLSFCFFFLQHPLRASDVAASPPALFGEREERAHQGGGGAASTSRRPEVAHGVPMKISRSDSTLQICCLIEETESKLKHLTSIAVSFSAS